MIEWFQSGGVVMWPLLVVAFGVGGLGVRTAVGISRDQGAEEIQRGLEAILFWGAMSVPLGLLGTVGGLVVMTEAIALVGAVEAPLVWGAVGVAMVPLVFALTIFLLALTVWFTLRGRHLRRLHVAATPV
jgi:biopolymer transport protein ExbB/TolQ